jgi:hypothetical protein
VETLHTFRSFLFGAKIDIYTDHENLTFNVDNTSSLVLCWRLLIEDFQPTIHHVAGSANVEADGLSRLPNLDVLLLEGQEDLSYDNDLHSFEAYLNYPDPDPNDPVFPLAYNVITEHQQTDNDLLESISNHPNSFQDVNLSGINLACFLCQCNDTWKIYMPSILVPLIIHWYHTVLGHVGIQRLYKTITNHFYAPQL